MPASAILLFEAGIIVRLFPVLRRAWALKGEPATVGITGRNARRVLFGAINLRTGHRIVMQHPAMSQAGFQAFLRLLRRAYPGRPIGLLLDEAAAHTTSRSQALARTLDIQLVWLPKQCPQLNAMDHLFKEVKADICANYQYQSIDEHADTAKEYLLKLNKQQASIRAGIRSTNFWLQSFLK